MLLRLFPLIALAGAALGWWLPQPLAELKVTIPWLLGVVMLGMGLTLTFQDFADILKRPALIILGLLMQFLLMPFFAWLFSLLLGLELMLLAGMVLVGSSPGGTASNVVCYLARGDVALSITLTTFSTLLAVILTPVITQVYLGESVPVPVWLMLLSIVKIVLLPVLAGMLINHCWHQRIAGIQPVFPAIAVACIVLIIAIVVALNHNNIPSLSLAVLLVVMLHNIAGMVFGYFVGYWFTRDHRLAVTYCIEVGMQNSGLAVALAVKYFTPLAALPGAIFSVWHNISGPLFAGWVTARGQKYPQKNNSDYIIS
jgi:BASS family bile acid:Na+ symporter